MNLGQEVKARFLTIPKDGTGRKETCEIRKGRVTYIHPGGRFVCVTTKILGGDVTEAFQLSEVIV